MTGKRSLENNPIQLQTVIRFWPLAAFIVSIYIAVSFYIGDYLIGWFHSAVLVVLVIGMPLCIRARKIVLASNLIAALGMVTIFPWLFTGGPGNSGFWLSITYVVGAFLVTTKRGAIFWLSLYLLLSIVAVVLSFYGIVQLAYSIPELINLLFIFIITFIFVYLFNKVIEYYLGLAEQRAEELSRINRDLSSSNKELEQFAYIASHDLQEPLRTVANFSQLLKDEYNHKLDDKADHYLEQVNNATLRMSGLIKSLLDFSRLGRNKQLRKIDCNELLKEVASDLEGIIDDSSARIEVSTMPTIYAYDPEMRQLFQNLILNAIKFRKKDTAPFICISAEKKEDVWLFTVSDNGIGIAPKYFQRIFTIFQRLHSIEEYEGNGIGLANCKKIVELHQGDIWVQSEIGKGSCFLFTIPPLKAEQKKITVY